jgi:hypothetical protein
MEGLALHKDVKTDCSINAMIKGKTYRFGSVDHELIEGKSVAPS